MSKRNAAGTIVLLMSPQEAEHFARLLGSAGSKATIANSATSGALSATLKSLVGPARLISFCSSVIVPGRVLRAFDAGCFNFHPGPPEYRGIMPSYFALRDGASQFGATFHSMSEEVDSGTIHLARRFPLDRGMSQQAVDVRVYRELLMMAQDLRIEIADLTHAFPASGDRWAGPLRTLRDLRALEAGGPERPAR